MPTRISPILFAIFSATVCAQRITVQSPDGVPLSMQKSGSGPAMLLVHGSASVSASWGATIPALNQRFTVYALDRRGRPPSGDAPKYSFDAEVDDLAAVLTSIKEPVILIGHSYGALIAVRAAATGKLATVTNLILYEPPVFLKPVPAHAKMMAEIAAATEAGDRDRITAAFVEGVLGFPPARIAAAKATPAWAGLVSLAGTYQREAESAEEFTVRAEDLAKWKKPTTMLLGSQSPDYMAEGTRFVCGAIPDCKIVTLDGQSHMAIQSAPALFVSSVLAAVEKISK